MLAFEVCPINTQAYTRASADHTQDENKTDDHTGHYADDCVSSNHFHQPIYDKSSQSCADRVRL